MEHLSRDVRYAIRALLRAPAFTLTVVLTVAIALGASTAVFSVADALLLRRLSVPSPDQLVELREHITTQTRDQDLFPTTEYERLRHLTGVFSTVAAEQMLDRSNITLSGAGGGMDPGRARVSLVSGNYFYMYGVAAERGRALGPSDEVIPSGHPVAVISHAYWQRRMAGATDVLTRTLTIHRTTYNIIGVIPPAFTGDWVGRPVDIWVPTMMQAEVMVDAPGYLRDRGQWPSAWLRVVARLKPGVSRETARSAAAVVHTQMVKEWEGPSPDAQQLEFDRARQLWLDPAARGYTPQRAAFNQSLMILAALVGAVLLLACANIAGLLVVRGSARERETALRVALGASRPQLIRRQMIESLLLAVSGGALGLTFAAWGSNALAAQATAGPEQMYWGASSWSSFDVGLHPRVLVFALLACLMSAMLFGLAPALRGVRLSLATALIGRGSATGHSRARSLLGRQLVVAQVSLSLVLLVAAGLLVRTLVNLRTQDMGFQTQHLLQAWTQSGVTSRTPRQLRDLYHITQERLARIPGVVSVAVTNHGSLDGSDPIGIAWNRVRFPGRPVETLQLVGWRAFVTPGFFATAGIPFVAGRDFTEFDTDSAPRVAIVNERFAKGYFGDVNPVGRFVRLGWEGDSLTQIIGVVRDYINGNPRERAKAPAYAYMPYRDRETGRRIALMSVLVRTAGDPRRLRDRIRTELRAIDPDLPVLKVDTIDEQLDDVLAQDRLMAGLASFFGVVALFLAALGLHGTIAYSTAQRTSEIGVRMAIGATPGNVLRMILREGLALVAIGVGIGAIVSAGAARVMAARLFEIAPTDPATLVAGALVLLGVAVLAAFFPAQRAARSDPVVALRAD